MELSGETLLELQGPLRARASDIYSAFIERNYLDKEWALRYSVFMRIVLLFAWLRFPRYKYGKERVFESIAKSRISDPQMCEFYVQ